MAGDYESTVLVGLLQNPHWLNSTARLTAADFEDKAHRVLYWAMLYYRQSKMGYTGHGDRYASAKVLLDLLMNHPFDPRAVEHRDAAVKRMRGLSGYSERVDWHTFQDAVDRVCEAGADRRAVTGLQSLVDRYFDGGAKGIRPAMLELYHRLDPTGGYSRGESLVEALPKRLEAYEDRRADFAKQRIFTGHPILDEIAPGVPGRLWLWAAYTSDGKSIFGRDLAYMAWWQGKHAVYVTAEMSEGDTWDALAVRHSHNVNGGPLDWQALAEGRLTPEQDGVYRRTIHEMTESANGGLIHVWKPPSRSRISEVRSKLMQYNQERPVDLVVLDYSSMFRPSDPSTDRHNTADQMLALFDELKGLSLDFDNNRGLWVVVLHQISRSGWADALKRGHYVLNDLAETRGAERAPDLVGWNYRDSEMRQQHEIKLGVSKNRLGRTMPEGWTCYENFPHSRIEVLMQ